MTAAPDPVAFVAEVTRHGRRLKFGDLELDATAGQLWRDGELVRMQPKVYGALLLFLARPGHLLSRRDLLDALWQDVVVNEEAITQTLRKLRRALGDDSKAPRFIETVPKRGYRFIATIETIATPTAAGPHTEVQLEPVRPPSSRPEAAPGPATAVASSAATPPLAAAAVGSTAPTPTVGLDIPSAPAATAVGLDIPSAPATTVAPDIPSTPATTAVGPDIPSAPAATTVGPDVPGARATTSADSEASSAAAAASGAAPQRGMLGTSTSAADSDPPCVPATTRVGSHASSAAAAASSAAPQRATLGTPASASTAPAMRAPTTSQTRTTSVPPRMSPDSLAVHTAAAPGPTSLRPQPGRAAAVTGRPSPTPISIEPIRWLGRGLGVLLTGLGVLSTLLDPRPQQTEAPVLAQVMAEPPALAPVPRARSVPVRVTFSPGRELALDLSADGRTAVVAVEEPGGGSRIERVQMDDGSRVKLTVAPGDDDEPALSPDGTQVVFTRTADGRHALWLVPTLGGTETLAIPDARRGVFAADGQTLAFVRHRQDGWTIERGQPGQPSTKVARVEGLPSALAWSHRTDQLAWVVEGTAWVVAAEGGTPRRLGDVPRGGRSLAWLPDDEGLVTDGVGEGTGAWRIDASSGEATPLLAQARRAWSPRLSADGGRLVYVEERRANEIWVHDPASPHDRILDTKSSLQCFSLDGTRTWLAALDAAPRGTETALRMLDPSTGARRNLATTARGCPGLSFDGRFVFASDERGDGTWIVSRHGDRPRKVGTRSIPTLAPAGSPDGRSLAIVTPGGLERVDVDGGDGTPLCSGRFGSPSWSHVGDTIAVSGEHDGEVGTFLVDARSGWTRRLTAHHSQRAAPIWADEDLALWILTDERGRARLIPVDMDGRTAGDPIVLVDRPDPSRWGVTEVRRGPGDTWLYMQTRIDADLWMVEIEGSRNPRTSSPHSPSDTRAYVQPPVDAAP